MKGKGPRIERETIINFNEEEETALIWTASKPEYGRLRKMGYCPHEENERSASFEVPKRCVSIRKTVAISKKRLQALERARARAKLRSIHKSLKLQGQNGEKGPLQEE